jgi:hypothetical protein
VRTIERGSIARPAAGGVAEMGLPPLMSLLELFRIKAICDFFPTACVLPVVNTLVSKSAEARSQTKRHDI